MQLVVEEHVDLSGSSLGASSEMCMLRHAPLLVCHQCRSPAHACSCDGKNTDHTRIETRRFGGREGNTVMLWHCLDESWDDLLYALKIQSLGTNPLIGSTMPPATLTKTFHMKRAKCFKQILRQLQYQDRMRTFCTFASNPIAPLQETTQFAADDNYYSHDQFLIRRLWYSGLRQRMQHVAAVEIIRARAARRLFKMHTWLESQGMKRETIMEPKQAARQHKNQQNHIRGPGALSDRSDMDCFQRQPTVEGGKGPHVSRGGVELLKWHDNAPHGSSRTANALAGDGLVDTATGSRRDIVESINREGEWRVRLAPPTHLHHLGDTGEWEGQIIPCLQSWGAEKIIIGELFMCMQDNTPLSPMPRCDVEVFRLKKADPTTYTGGLEVTDVDVIQSLLVATPSLLENAPGDWAFPLNSGVPHDTRESKVVRIEARRYSHEAQHVMLSSRIDPSLMVEEAWRLIEELPSDTCACLPMPSFVESDLAYCFLQSAVEAKAGNVPQSIIPPFADIPPMSCSLGRNSFSNPMSVWPSGESYHETVICYPSTTEQQVSHLASVGGTATHASQTVKSSASRQGYLFLPQQGTSNHEAGLLGGITFPAEKELDALASEEYDHAVTLRKQSMALAEIWGTSRREQQEVIFNVNKKLPHEFQAP
ncbi:uncharacterized protein LOC34622457 [Cyclospora cayetanensis]|uniref:Uncharacterized protein LOC34622457 n=1 Tax=Cyclospora cayetanensis TaxID=88456 RepID=A0A6P6RSI6_9EIME|nr:uncharacterized protein LOC34622457 [Cyclospora cayetanensis]